MESLDYVLSGGGLNRSGLNNSVNNDTDGNTPTRGRAFRSDSIDSSGNPPAPPPNTGATPSVVTGFNSPRLSVVNDKLEGPPTPPPNTRATPFGTPYIRSPALSDVNERLGRLGIHEDPVLSPLLDGNDSEKATDPNDPADPTDEMSPTAYTAVTAGASESPMYPSSEIISVFLSTLVHPDALARCLRAADFSAQDSASEHDTATGGVHEQSDWSEDVFNLMENAFASLKRLAEDDVKRSTTGADIYECMAKRLENMRAKIPTLNLVLTTVTKKALDSEVDKMATRTRALKADMDETEKRMGDLKSKTQVMEEESKNGTSEEVKHEEKHVGGLKKWLGLT